jgi:hypothetical protein
MKNKMATGLVVVGLVMSGAAFSAFAQNGPGQGRNGNSQGYGGPPQSQEERVARQAACLEKNGGTCPNGGPRTNCPGLGQGHGKGAGHGWRRGACDGTGPLNTGATCPKTNSPAKQ